jgi:uncharacterized protein YndB with AHSA1/START domain
MSSSTEIRVSRVIDATAHDLYQAFIDPAQHVIWGPTRFENDPRIGGRFHQETDMGDATYIIDGDYPNLIPDRLIAMNWNFFQVMIEIEPDIEGGSRITVTETGPSITETTPGDDFHDAWEQVFTTLETYLLERKSTKEEQK